MVRWLKYLRRESASAALARIRFLLAGTLVLAGAQRNASAAPGVPALVDLNATLPGLRSSTAAWGDYDQDGDLDLLLAGLTAGGQRLASVYRNDTEGVFIQIELGLPSIAAGALSWADYDRDGDLDFGLLGDDGTNRYLRVYRNDGGDRFGTVVLLSPAVEGGALAWLDLDNDGDLDLAVAGFLDGSTRVFRNEGFDSFTDAGIRLPALSLGALAGADYDKDGDTDLALTGRSTGGNDLGRLYRSDNGRFSFTDSSVQILGTHFSSLAWGDYDNDNDPDLLLTGSRMIGGQAFPTTELYRNNRPFATNFTTLGGLLPGLQQGRAAWGDFDNDGWLDVALCGYSSAFVSFAQIQRNLANGAFANIGLDLPGVIDGTVAWGDLDNDGDLDLALLGNPADGSELIGKIIRNDSFIPNTPPEPPAALTATVVSNAVILAWAPSTDANQSGGLTYNVRLGQQPGAGNIVSPMAVPDGRRLLPAPGNAGARLQLTVTNLAAGSYFWSVQAIDHTYAGSIFPAEGSFALPPRAPEVLTRGATDVQPTRATARGIVLPNLLETLAWFEHGTNLSLGSRTIPRSVGDGVQRMPVTEQLTGLVPGVTSYYRLVASNSLGTTFGATTNLFPPAFLEVHAPFTDLAADGLAWGDYDRDGDLDLLMTGFYFPTGWTRIFRNDGGGAFTGLAFTLPGTNGAAVAWGDYDHDGDLDILLATGDRTRVYRYDGNDTFTDLNLALAGHLQGAAAHWLDSDNDGDLDILLFGASTGGQAHLYRNDGAGQFVGVNGAPPNITAASTALGDFDEDRRVDVMVTGNGPTRLYRNDGQGSFAALLSSPFRNIYESAVVAGAFGNLPRLDLVLSGYDGTNYLAEHYLNEGRGVFTRRVAPQLPRVTAGLLGIGDFNNDGGLDLVLTGRTTTNSLGLVLSAGYQQRLAFLEGVSGGALAVGDYDNDGGLDLVLSGYTGTRWITRLYHNQAVTANPPPVPPGGLRTTVSNSLVNFQWAPSIDANQSGGFSYNLRVGTTLPGAEVMRPPSDLSTGRLLIPQLGNAGLGTSWPINGLELGTYYWSVQALDHSFAGSAFSTNATLLLGPGSLPPGLRDIRVEGLTATRSLVEAQINPRGVPTLSWVDYGPTTNLGFRTLAQSVGDGLDYLPVSMALPALISATNYYYRVSASNVAGLTRSKMDVFTSLAMFSTISNGLPTRSQLQGAAVGWADYDNDGFLDLAMGGGHTSWGTFAKVFRGDGTGQFTDANAGLPGSWHGSLAWGDYDHDGFVDLLLDVTSLGGFSLFRNDAGHGFSSSGLRFAASDNTESSSWVDYDNDGDLDVFVVAEPESRLFRNEGTNRFAELPLDFPSVSYGSAAWADFDHDGDSDLLLTGQSILNGSYSRLSGIFRNDGADQFTDISAGLLPLAYSSAAWGDLDNDSWPDLVLVGREHDPPLDLYYAKVYRNQRDGSFGEVATGLPGLSGDVALADFDNDGSLDLVLNGGSTVSSSVRVFFGVGQGQFTDGGVVASYPVRAVAAGDYDNDGDLDFLMDGQLIRNNSPSPNTPPSSPTGLQAVVTRNLATLSWNPSADPEQSGGLTYDLVVGTSPGDSDVVTPGADALTGWRRLPRPGLAHAPLWKLELPVGRYYWRVQAVDHALAGSSFSDEGSFTILPQAPQVRTLEVQTNAQGELVMHGVVTPNAAVTLWYFEFGQATNYGQRTLARSLDALLPSTAVSNSVIPWPAALPYHYRLVASNQFGLSYGADVTFAITAFVEVPGAIFSELAMAPSSWGDFDNDGDLDLLGPGGVLQNQQGRLTHQGPILYAGPFNSYTAWGDGNGDGWIDFGVISSFGGSYSGVWRNERTNPFTNLHVPLVASGPLTWADFDNDGDLDLLVAGTDPAVRTRLMIYRNDGHDTFTPMPTALPAVTNPTLAWGDYDGDGDLDALLSGSLSSRPLCRLYRNDGNGLFVEVATPFAGVELGSLVWSDFDNDRDLDVLVCGITNANYDSISRLYRNEGNGLFVDANAGLPGQNGGSAAWGDYDHDGRLDLLLTGHTNALADSAFVTVFRQDPPGTFTPAVQLPSYVFTDATWADYDADGRLDVLLAYRARNLSRIYRNLTPSWNPAPVAPSFPTATVSNTTVILRWNDAQDRNQPAGLTYNLRVGRTPDDQSIRPAMSDLGSGRRRVPQPGNAGPRAFAVLEGLAVGGYYWSVQAVDHSFAGSPFSATGHFVIPVQVPRVVTGLASNLSATAATLTGAVTPNGLASAASFQFSRSTTYTHSTAWQPVGSGLEPISLSMPIRDLAPLTTYHYRLLATNIAGVLYGVDRTFTTPLFTTVDMGLPNSPGTVAWADHDHDEDLDLLFAVSSIDFTLLFRNDGPGQLTQSGIRLPGLNSADFAWGDYDADGDLDLLATGFNGSVHYSTRVYRNDGGGSFTSLSSNFVNVTGTCAWGDLDNDGDLDFVISGGDGNNALWRTYRNEGGDRFTLMVNGGFDFSGEASLVDADNDGDLDLFITGWHRTARATTKLFRNDGRGNLTDSGLALPGLRGSHAWGDYDNDGDLDVIVLGATNNFANEIGAALLLRNEGNGAFLEVETGLPQVLTPGAAAWGDADNDGDLDLLVGGTLDSEQPLLLVLNDGAGRFSRLNTLLPDIAPGGLAWSDVDEDGDLDFAVTGHRGSSYATYASRLAINAQPTANLPPRAPSGLVARPGSRSVTLSWQATVDVNQTGGHTYQLVVGTTPGLGNVLAPASDLATGHRRVAELGHAQQRLSWTLTNLSAGAYYWSVQAIDHSFAGSAFAPWEAFAITNQLNTPANDPPQALALSFTLPEDTRSSVTLAGFDPEGAALSFAIVASPANGTLAGIPPDLVYFPQTNFFGTDSFRFQVNDGAQFSAPAIVLLNVLPVADALSTSLTLEMEAGRGFTLRLRGEPRQLYRLEASSDLVNWIPLNTLPASVDGVIEFTDPAPEWNQRFYRARPAP